MLSFLNIMELSENFCTYREHTGYKSPVCKFELHNLANCPRGLSEVQLFEGHRPYMPDCEKFEINPSLRNHLFVYLIRKREKEKKRKRENKQRWIERTRNSARK